MKALRYFGLFMILLYLLGGIGLVTRMIQFKIFDPQTQIFIGIFCIVYAAFRYTRWRKLPF